MFHQINFLEIVSAFIVMFAVIDIIGSIPIFLDLRQRKEVITAWKSCTVALFLFVLFFFAGDALLRMFGVDTASFAVAGSFVIFVLALEMILGVEIIKNEGGKTKASIVPVAFPLIAGPGALTALLSLRAEYAVVNIMIALALNILLDFVVIVSVDKIRNILGNDLIFIVRKFFGVILLAIAVQMFATNVTIMVGNLGR